MPEKLTTEQQIVEIREEFITESLAFSEAQGVARESLLNHINALLDCYLELAEV